ncbi:hypothetical protein LK09_14890 [Microbacterium mangrovi]|uniref:HTH asnC-type domain-containing protein n=1 Tax=Microbacterium mangrovi TaxID=1348253 RepID=A0A0B2A490_9MICO|nr:hypothetical protein LK09_14890 [Microbacterium mangrovi]
MDRAVVHAIERSPRASWKSLGDVIDVDPATVARRWARLEREGLAWVTCYPLLTQDPASAFVEISCRAGTTEDVAAAIARHPEALFVDIVTGGTDILITAVSADQAGLSDYVLRRLPLVSGVEDVQTQPVVTVHFEGGYAAAGSLERRAAVKLPTPEHGVLIRTNIEVDDLDWELCIALSRDGRQPVADLARAVGLSETAVGRRLRRLSSQGALRMIVELTPDAAGRSAIVWVYARVPAGARSLAVRRIAEMPGVRTISSIAGPENLAFKVALPHLSALDDFETRVSEIEPDLVIADRKIVLRQVRLMSRLIDPLGRAIGVLPIDLRARGR